MRCINGTLSLLNRSIKTKGPVNNLMKQKKNHMKVDNQLFRCNSNCLYTALCIVVPLFPASARLVQRPIILIIILLPFKYIYIYISWLFLQYFTMLMVVTRLQNTCTENNTYRSYIYQVILVLHIIFISLQTLHEQLCQGATYWYRGEQS
jgi:hypothetical protein